MTERIAGIVLAGGRSSRMGRDKAMLPHGGRSMLAGMVGKLENLGLHGVFVSGSQQIDGHETLQDKVAGEGPAAAILGMAGCLYERGYGAALIVPVDMPLLTEDILCPLLGARDGAFYSGHVFPVFVPLKHMAQMAMTTDGAGLSVRALLERAGVRPLSGTDEPDERCFLNVNTPEDYARIA